MSGELQLNFCCCYTIPAVNPSYRHVYPWHIVSLFQVFRWWGAVQGEHARDKKGEVTLARILLLCNAPHYPECLEQSSKFWTRRFGVFRIEFTPGFLE